MYYYHPHALKAKQVTRIPFPWRNRHSTRWETQNTNRHGCGLVIIPQPKLLAYLLKATEKVHFCAYLGVHLGRGMYSMASQCHFITSASYPVHPSFVVYTTLVMWIIIPQYYYTKFGIQCHMVFYVTFWTTLLMNKWTNMVVDDARGVHLLVETLPSLVSNLR